MKDEDNETVRVRVHVVGGHPFHDRPCSCRVGFKHQVHHMIHLQCTDSQHCTALWNGDRGAGERGSVISHVLKLQVRFEANSSPRDLRCTIIRNGDCALTSSSGFFNSNSFFLPLFSIFTVYSFFLGTHAGAAKTDAVRDFSFQKCFQVECFCKASLKQTCSTPAAVRIEH